MKEYWSKMRLDLCFHLDLPEHLHKRGALRINLLTEDGFQPGEMSEVARRAASVMEEIRQRNPHADLHGEITITFKGAV